MAAQLLQSETQASATPVNAAEERQRLRVALSAAAAELRALAEQVSREIGSEEAGIFEAQALMVEDPTIVERADALIDAEGAHAEHAVSVAAEEQAVELAALPDPLWQARAADVRDAARRVVTHLQPEDARPPTLAQQLAETRVPVVVVADDLAPSDTAQMRAERVVAIALVHGSATAHAAILARALGIPAVAGLGTAIFAQVHAGDTLIVDGTGGSVVLTPTEAERAEAQHAADELRRGAAASHARRAAQRERPGQTRDGKAVPLLANVGNVTDALAAAEAGAEGIGLLRTEFLFSDRATLPNEHEQAGLYREIIEALGPVRGPIIVRTLDAGADKPLPALAPYLKDLPTEANPALGVRGIRLQSAIEGLLATQLRGLLRAAAQTQTNIQIMLPMVAALEELRAAQAQLEAARAALASEGIQLDVMPPLGMMVETPAAVFAIEAMARETAFFSLGTNDLTQYVMAADRLNPAVSQLSQPTQPGVLHAIALVVESAHRIGRHVGVCGEMGGDPRLAPLLVGLGVDELSMTPASIPAVKEALAARTSDELRAMAERALQAATAAEVERLLDESR